MEQIENDFDNFMERVNELEDIIKGNNKVENETDGLKKNLLKKENKIKSSINKIAFDELEVEKQQSMHDQQVKEIKKELISNKKSSDVWMLDMEADAIARSRRRIENKKKSNELKKIGNECYKNNRFKEAIEYYKRCLVYIKDNMDVYRNCSLAYNKLNKCNESIKYCDMALKMEPNDIKAMYIKSESYFMLENFSEVRNLYQEILQTNNPLASKLINTDKFEYLNIIEKLSENIAIIVKPEIENSFFLKFEKLKAFYKRFESTNSIRLNDTLSFKTEEEIHLFKINDGFGILGKLIKNSTKNKNHSHDNNLLKIIHFVQCYCKNEINSAYIIFKTNILQELNRFSIEITPRNIEINKGIIHLCNILGEYSFYYKKYLPYENFNIIINHNNKNDETMLCALKTMNSFILDNNFSKLLACEILENIDYTKFLIKNLKLYKQDNLNIQILDQFILLWYNSSTIKKICTISQENFKIVAKHGFNLMTHNNSYTVSIGNTTQSVNYFVSVYEKLNEKEKLKYFLIKPVIIKLNETICYKKSTDSVLANSILFLSKIVKDLNINKLQKCLFSGNTIEIDMFVKRLISLGSDSNNKSIKLNSSILLAKMARYID
ncbi:TPR repeat protein 12, partial [Intoshia linei]